MLARSCEQSECVEREGAVGEIDHASERSPALLERVRSKQDREFDVLAEYIRETNRALHRNKENIMPWAEGAFMVDSVTFLLEVYEVPYPVHATTPYRSK